MAKLEKDMGVRSTYYFRWDPKLPGRTEVHKWEKGNFLKRSIVKVQQYGHEVGYHYENLSELKDKTKALKDFAVKLGWFTQFAPVQTVAIGADLNAYGLLGEPYLSAQFADIVYVTDSGRR